MDNRAIALAMTGASGAQYGFRLLEQLIKADHSVYLMISKAAQVVIGMETDMALPGRTIDIHKVLVQRYEAAADQLRVFGEDEWTAPVASGSNDVRAMVVCPCSMGALSAIACGASNNLLERAADVTLKEKRKLVLVIRETPLHKGHLRLMSMAADMGAHILPPVPSFYHMPKTIDDIIDQTIGKIFDFMGIEHDLFRRWGDESNSAPKNDTALKAIKKF